MRVVDIDIDTDIDMNQCRYRYIRMCVHVYMYIYTHIHTVIICMQAGRQAGRQAGAGKRQGRGRQASLYASHPFRRPSLSRCLFCLLVSCVQTVDTPSQASTMASFSIVCRNGI